MINSWITIKQDTRGGGGGIGYSGKMAGVGGRAAAHLSRHLARLRLLQGSRLTQGHAAAFLHTTPALDGE